MEEGDRFNIFAAIIVLFTIFAIIYVTKEFVSIIILSMFLAYVLNPLNSYLMRITRNSQVASFLSLLIVFAAFGLFLLKLLDALIVEISNIAVSTDSIYAVFSGSFEQVSALLDTYIPLVDKYVPLEGFDLTEDISQLFSTAAGWIIPQVRDFVTSIAASTPLYLAGFAVAILLTYYLLIDGNRIVDNYLKIVPESHKSRMELFLHELNEIYNSLFNVYLLTCLLTGLIGTAGFFLAGISYPVLLGVLVFLFALIPLVGPSALYIPMAIYYLLIRDYTTAIFLVLFGTIFLNILPDNFIRPRLAQKKASIHPIITLLSFAAPIFVIGVMGVIIGPALYGFLLAVYRTRVGSPGEQEADNKGHEGLISEDEEVKDEGVTGDKIVDKPSIVPKDME